MVCRNHPYARIAHLNGVGDASTTSPPTALTLGVNARHGRQLHPSDICHLNAEEPKRPTSDYNEHVPIACHTLAPNVGGHTYAATSEVTDQPARAGVGVVRDDRYTSAEESTWRTRDLYSMTTQTNATAFRLKAKPSIVDVLENAAFANTVGRLTMGTRRPTANSSRTPSREENSNDRPTQTTRSAPARAAYPVTY